MLSAILGILGSAGFGSIFGALGGIANRYMDMKAKRLDMEAKAADNSFELLRMDKQREYAMQEAAARLQITQVQTDGLVETAGYTAMEKSYETMRPTGIGWIDAISQLVRPLLTAAFFAFMVYMWIELQARMSAYMAITDHSPEMLIDLYIDVTKGIAFQAFACLGWWFAMRPGKAPSFR